MNRTLMIATMAFIAGVVVGFCKEDEIHDLSYEANKMKRKLVHEMDDMCDCCK